MFEKLFLLVKNNAGMAVIDNPSIPEKYHEAVINEASSSIIDVLKNQVEGGKLKEVIKHFQHPDIYNDPLTNSVVNKFANKLNTFYNLSPADALATSKMLMPQVMQELVKASKVQDTDFALATFLSKLTGNRTGMSMLVNKMVAA
ncbi:hypothetical protein GCM10023149_26920 [Mucilaginibacter gynuensis]|uniref:DUF1641 domain-containing protein n=1 Tax=Mucilaginibacter gynuensis TaxID=1302236 RepID=A0ABP8GIN4_9SPHI